MQEPPNGLLRRAAELLFTGPSNLTTIFGHTLGKSVSIQEHVSYGSKDLWLLEDGDAGRCLQASGLIWTVCEWRSDSAVIEQFPA
jgi:hypothetical protein